jgi:hypothetical protein
MMNFPRPTEVGGSPVAGRQVGDRSLLPVELQEHLPECLIIATFGQNRSVPCTCGHDKKPARESG